VSGSIIDDCCEVDVVPVDEPEEELEDELELELELLDDELELPDWPVVPLVLPLLPDAVPEEEELVLES
jgi:hypothetical protein